MKTNTGLNRKFGSLLLLALAFGVGAFTADYRALFAGTSPVGSNVTLLIALLLGVGVCGWYRIVKSAAEQHEWRERECRLSNRSSVLSSNSFPSDR